jgi:hypothetical protein
VQYKAATACTNPLFASSVAASSGCPPCFFGPVRRDPTQAYPRPARTDAACCSRALRKYRPGIPSAPDQVRDSQPCAVLCTTFQGWLLRRYLRRPAFADLLPPLSWAHPMISSRHRRPERVLLPHPELGCCAAAESLQTLFAVWMRCSRQARRAIERAGTQTGDGSLGTKR